MRKRSTRRIECNIIINKLLKMRKISSIIYLMLALLISTASCISSPQVSADNNYLGNIYIYYTWNTSFYICVLWGLLFITIFADKGLAYTSCINNFQVVFPMNSI
jgi:hypothetical protein